MTPHGHFHWNELMTRNLEKTKAFYHDALGWEFQAVPMVPSGTYWLVVDGETPVCGLFEVEGAEYEGQPDSWMGYIAVDDVDARVAKAREGGAVVVTEPFDVPEVGRMAVLQPPGGANIAWMTPVATD
mgnify:CR=1 FL=1